MLVNVSVNCFDTRVAMNRGLTVDSDLLGVCGGNQTTWIHFFSSMDLVFSLHVDSIFTQNLHHHQNMHQTQCEDNQSFYLSMGPTQIETAQSLSLTVLFF